MLRVGIQKTALAISRGVHTTEYAGGATRVVHDQSPVMTDADPANAFALAFTVAPMYA